MALVEGVWVSFILTVLGAIVGFALAVGLSVARHVRIPLLRTISATYVELVRNTPLIVQMFFVAFGLPMLLNYQCPFWGHALLALALNFSAYFAEILRSGYQSIPSGQLECATALGLPPRIKFWRIVFPQAVAHMYPSLSSQFIFLFLTTGVISEIGARDLTYAGTFIDSRTFRTFEVFITLTVIYLLMSFGFKLALKELQQLLLPWWRQS